MNLRRWRKEKIGPRVTKYPILTDNLGKYKTIRKK